MKIWMRRPDNDRRRTFGIVLNGKAFRPSELVSINAAYAKGDLTFAQAEQAVQALMDAKRPPEPKVGSGNLKIFKAWWAVEKQTRTLKNPRDAENDYLRALTDLGLVSVFGPIKDIKAKFVSMEPQIARRRISRINEIRGQLPRVPKPPKPQKTVRYLTPEQVELVAASLPELEVFIWTLFGTGCRVGEAIALTEVNQGKVAKVDWQFHRREKKLTLPKRDKTRSCLVLSMARDWVQRWLAIPMSEREQYLTVPSAVLTNACRELFSEDIHHCKLHDLRHSYARYLLSKGMNFNLICDNLGDRMTVVEDYYTGWKRELQDILRYADDY